MRLNQIISWLFKNIPRDQKAILFSVKYELRRIQYEFDLFLSINQAGNF